MTRGKKDTGILVIGPNFFRYTENLAECLSSRGYSVKQYLTLGGKYHKLIAFLKRINREELSDKLRRLGDSESTKQNRKDILSLYENFKPGYVLLIKGSYLSKDIIDRISLKSDISLWMMDSYSRFPDLFPIAQSVKHCYVFEASDIEAFSEFGINMTYLPMGYNDFIYKPLENSRKDIDICFVGSMYPFRRDILIKLLTDFPKLHIQFSGGIVSRFHPIAYRRFMKLHSKSIINKNISHDEINNLYNRSKICLNISHSQSYDGWNPRTMEILGAGAFQIATENKAIRDNFDGCVETFQGYDELREKIVHFISHPEEREEIARRGHLAVKGRHSFNNRIDTICRDWGLNK